jgi:transposase
MNEKDNPHVWDDSKRDERIKLGLSPTPEVPATPGVSNFNRKEWEKIEIMRRYSNGDSRKIIAKALEIKETAVSSTISKLRKNGKQIPKRKPGRARSIDDKAIAEIVGLFKNGKTTTAIADKFKISKGYINRIIVVQRKRGIGIPLRKRGRKPKQPNSQIQEKEQGFIDQPNAEPIAFAFWNSSVAV